MEVVHDPDRKEDDDEDNGNGGSIDDQIPARSFFTQDVQKKDRLDAALQDSQHKNRKNIHLHTQVKKVRAEENTKGSPC